jgi:hypothetical protein
MRGVGAKAFGSACRNLANILNRSSRNTSISSNNFTKIQARQNTNNTIQNNTIRNSNGIHNTALRSLRIPCLRHIPSTGTSSRSIFSSEASITLKRSLSKQSQKNSNKRTLSNTQISSNAQSSPKRSLSTRNRFLSPHNRFLSEFEQATVRTLPKMVDYVTCAELKSMIEDPNQNVQIIDVRDDDHEGGHIPGSRWVS